MASPGYSLQLSKLALATGVSPASMSLAIGTTSQASFSNFEISSVSSLTVNNPSPGYGINFTATLNFTGEGAKFEKIKNRTANYTWASVGNTTIINNNASNIVYRNDYNPAGTNCSTNISVPLAAKFYDQGYNFNASGYNTNFNSTVTLYAPPKPIITVSNITRPSTCSNPPNCNVTITVQANPGTYQGITGSVLTFYKNGSFDETITTSTTVLKNYTGLLSNTVYNLYVVNNFNCQSNSAVGATTYPYP
jgi:hypothetical protein